MRRSLLANFEPRRGQATLCHVEGVVGSSHAVLVAEAKKGDSEAFARLVEPYLPKALSSTRLILGGSGESSDAVQEALISAWRDLSHLREASAFGAWFRQHVVRSALRMARHRPPTVGLSEGWADPIDHMERSMASRQLQRAFDSLDANDRVVLTLRYHLDLTNDESSRLLKVPVGTVKSRVHYALRRLRAAYGAQERK